jgi:transcriptional regulator with XRE-family HTH domain
MAAHDGIGSGIKTMRKRAGLTQRQLAERLGVTHNTVSRWETGERMPRNLRALCTALECTLTDLLGATE